jgi:flagellar basal-body rod protein FlgG
MYEAVMIAATGLTNQQRRIDSIADNVANVNTAGYRAERLDFKDALYTAGIVPATPRTPEGNQQHGHGVMIASITREFFQGGLTETGNQLDFALEGKGFFEFTDQNGALVYTRGGNFYLSDSGDGRLYLVNSSGYFVNDENGNKITAPQDTTSVSVSEDGVISFLTGDSATEVRLGIYGFRNEAGLNAVGSGNFAQSAISGEKYARSDVRLVQGSLEMSNVNLAQEMTRLIRAQRAFSLAGRALTTADDMEGLANSLRR